MCETNVVHFYECACKIEISNRFHYTNMWRQNTTFVEIFQWQKQTCSKEKTSDRKLLNLALIQVIEKSSWKIGEIGIQVMHDFANIIMYSKIEKKLMYERVNFISIFKYMTAQQTNYRVMWRLAKNSFDGKKITKVQK